MNNWRNISRFKISSLNSAASVCRAFGQTLLIAVLLIGLLAGCRQAQPDQAAAAATAAASLPSPISPTATATATKTIPPSPTPSPSPAPTSTPRATATVTPTPTETIVPTPSAQQVLAQLIGSPEWQALQLPEETAALWERYARGEGRLSAEEQAQMETFVRHWVKLQELARASDPKRVGRLGFRVQVDGSGAAARLLPYAVDAKAPPEASRPYLTVYNGEGKAVSVVQSPAIEGLQVRLAGDGETLEYLSNDGKVMLTASAEALTGKGKREKILLDILRKSYKDRIYNPLGIFPRFRFTLEGVNSYFYGIERSLTPTQLVLLHDALELYNRPEFQPLKEAFFDDGTSILAPPDLEKASGLTYVGTGVVELDRRDLFGDRYEVAEVLGHEAAHVMQGAVKGKATCAEMLQREVGDQKIPNDFTNWDAQRLLDEIRGGTIGSYHVSLWMLAKMGIKDWRMDVLREIIFTGKLNGISVVIDC